MADFDLKLKALSRLAESPSPEAAAAIERELAKASEILHSGTDYDLLDQQLQIVEVIGYRTSERAVHTLRAFTERAQSLVLTYSPLLLSISDEPSEYHSVTSLTVDAIDALMRLRYLETNAVVRMLLDLSLHSSEDVRSRALRGLEEVAAYNITVVHGGGGQHGIGFYPQTEILSAISDFKDDEIRVHLNALVTLLNALLSPTMESTSWTYNQVTFSRGQVPADTDLAQIREEAIGMLLRAYEVVDGVSSKLSIVGALSGATSARGIRQLQEDFVLVLVRDTLRVLGFFQSLIAHEEFQIVQKVERYSYWIFYHAIAPEVVAAARKVEVEVASNTEYVIYRTLIGFEAVFGDWEENKTERTSHRDVDDYRREKAREYAASISLASRAAWQQRILKFARTQSDDLATFPVFYYFLEQVAQSDPEFTLRLIRLHTKELERFLIPLLRGLSVGPEAKKTRALVRKWASEGRYIYQSVTQFLGTDSLNMRLIKSLLRRAIELNDVRSLAMLITVAISNYNPKRKILINALFLPALRALTERSNADWIHEVWFRREARAFFEALDSDSIDEVLKNLLSLKKLDYQAEEILYLVASKRPEKVIQFLCERLNSASTGSAKSRRTFDAIPFELHKLQEPLSKCPRTMVRAVRKTYDGNYGLFIHRGAHLLRVIFPTFPEPFEAELINVLDNNSEDDTLFVLAVLRNYEGQPFIHRTCKEIVKKVPSDSRLRTEVAVALESTGVVSGEFGFAEAYEQKREEVKDWLNDADLKVQEFAKWYIGTLETMAVVERQRAQEDIALRKHKYGE